MARKRKLSGALPEEELPAVEEAPRKGAMGGMWAGSAMNMLKQRIDSTHGSMIDALMAGTLALELDPDQIVDDLGSDRFTNWVEDEDFDRLVANIARRGQTQPIRVRPASEEWSPNEEAPLETDAKFVIQSGRRRLEACRKLGRKVLAVVSTKAGNQALADLEERFHENTMRRDLNGFEELISIGLLAESMSDLTQTEIAERIGVSQADVSLGQGCLTHRDEIMRQVDIEATPKRAYRAILPKIKRHEPIKTPDYDKPIRQRYDVRGIPMSTVPVQGGFDVSISKARVAEEDLDDMLIEMAKLIMKYQRKKP
ncbi:ParB N-terminal domain-containing protein [uncultured Tateyamaria sp.]|uniref:ParB N-terminal domain-containing protein n=1 Tax=uncultured Tateyamaria sp. TaxID=455651 RepID=UPI00261DC953|nr:ParB N-terminal domain-containing protein [uncultured Tateyamaria sp.]